MPNLVTKHYRRDYTGEVVTYVEDNAMRSIRSEPRDLPRDFGIRSAIVVGNGPSKNLPEIQLLINSNSRKLAENYKMTYACNLAFHDSSADYFVISDKDILQTITPDSQHKCFVSYDIWITHQQTNLIPYYSHLDSGTTAAYLAAFDGAKNVFLLGFDGTDGSTVDNVYAGQTGYEQPSGVECFRKFHMYLHDLVKLYPNVNFYRVRTMYSGDMSVDMSHLPNFHETTVREAVLLGDF
jgi:hypothetical protein